MIFISKLEFKNVTITYSDEKANKKICKRKNRYMNIWCVLCALFMSIFLFFGAWITCSMSTIVISIFFILFLGIEIGFVFLGYWLIYHKINKTFFFVEWLFKVEEVYAGWFNDKILLRVQHSNGINDYSLQGFIKNIKNELVITDRSDRNKPIHIFIDVTDDEKTKILIDSIKK